MVEENENESMAEETNIIKDSPDSEEDIIQQQQEHLRSLTTQPSKQEETTLTHEEAFEGVDEGTPIPKGKEDKYGL